MSGSNRRPASSGPLLCVLLLVICCAGVRAAPPPTLRFALESRADAQRDVLLEQDRAWLAGLTLADPPESTTVAIEADSTAAESPGGRLPLPSALRRRWLDRGYLACSVRFGVAMPDMPALLLLDPGPLFHLGTLTVDGETFVGRQDLLTRHLPPSGAVYAPRQLEAAVERLLAEMGENGYPFAHWILRRVRIDPQTASVDIEALLSSGRVAVLGRQTCSLESERGLVFLRKVTRMRENAPFRESDLQAARRRLQRRDLYVEVGEPVVYALSTPDSVGVFWPVVPGIRDNRLSFILGLQRAAAEDPARVSGQIDLEMRNIADTGRGLDLAWSDDGRARSHFSASWREPLVFGTPFDILGGLDHEVVEDVYTRFRVDLGAEMGIVGDWTLALGLGHDRNTFPAGTWIRSSRWRTRAAIVRRRPDPALSGWAARAVAESARRGSVARSDSVYADGLDSRAGEERQTLVELGIESELWVGPQMSLAAGVLYKDVDSNAPILPLAEHYRLGGATSLRGYREDQFHGQRVGSLSLELRVGRARGSRLYSFLDIGYFRYAAPDIGASAAGAIVTVEQTLKGFGLGLETRTAGGELSLAIGFPGSFVFDDAKLHVRHRQTF